MIDRGMACVLVYVSQTPTALSSQPTISFLFFPFLSFPSLRQVPESVTALSIVYVEGLVFACGAEGVVGSTGKVGGIVISKVRAKVYT